eukprot:gene8566-391_t
MNHNQNLLVSAANGDLQGVIESLSNGADINSKDSNGFTALQFATYNSQVEVVQILIEAHADPNVFDYKNYNNFTPLHYAASFNQMELVKILLQSEINPHVPNGEAQFPLNLTGSEEIKNVIYEDQEKRRKNQPQQQYQTQPQQQFQPQLQTQCRWSMCAKGGCGKLTKNLEKIFGVLFFLFPLVYCVFTPFGFPWFIYPCGIMLSVVAFKKIKKQKEKLKEEGVYRFYIHALVFVVLNGFNFIACLWWRTLFFAVSMGSVWGSLLAVHALKSKYQKSKKNNGFFIHALIFGAFLLASFVTYTHISCMNHYPKNHGGHHHHQGYNRQQGSQHHYRYQSHEYRHSFGCNRQLIPMFIWFLPMMIWAVILFVHHLRRKGQTEISCCGLKISYGENQNQTETEIEREEASVEDTNVQQESPQQVEEINVEPTPDFNNPQNVQILYPKVL